MSERPRLTLNTALDGSLTCGNGSAWGANGCGPCAGCVAELAAGCGPCAGCVAELAAGEWPIQFICLGKAEPKGSMVTYGRGRTTSANPNLKAWELAVAWSGRQQAAGVAGLADGPVRVSLQFVLRRPKSIKADAVTKKPDLDKLVRAVLDALTGVLWVDDAQVVELWAGKRYETAELPPAVHVKVGPHAG